MPDRYNESMLFLTAHIRTTRLAVLATAFLLATLLAISPVDIAQASKIRTIIRLTDAAATSTTAAQRATFVEQINGPVLVRSNTMLVAEITTVEATRLSQNPLVASVYPDLPMSTGGADWGLDRIDQTALPLSRSFSGVGDGAGVDIYIIDSGVAAQHTAFGGRVLPGVDFVGDGRTATQDCHGHGTHVAGLAAGASYGVAPKATIIPVRVIDCNNRTWFSNVILGLDWVVSSMATRGRPAVVNLSLGCLSPCSTSDVVRSINTVIDAGAVVTIAAMNNNDNACNYGPPMAERALVLGATDKSDHRSGFSNFGTCLDLFAPGSGVTSAAPSGRSAVMSGTSMAAPLTAGVAALLRAASPLATPDEIVATLKKAAVADILLDTGTGSPNLLLQIPSFAPFGALPPSVVGLAVTGLKLAGGASSWSGNPRPVVTYDWLRCATPGESSAETPVDCVVVSTVSRDLAYTLGTADTGSYLRLRTTASNTAGSATLVSTSSRKVASFTISGQAKVKSTLSVSFDPGDPAATVSYAWLLCGRPASMGTTLPARCTVISGAVTASYTANSSDRNKYLAVRVTMVSDGITSIFYSATSGAVAR